MSTLSDDNLERLTQYNNALKSSDEIYRGIAKSFGIPECTFWIYYTLRVEPKALTQSEICKFLLQPKQTVNSALKNLEAEGEIELVPQAGRVRLIRLTALGTERASRAVDPVIAAEKEALGSLSDEEFLVFIRAFRLFNSVLRGKIKSIVKES